MRRGWVVSVAVVGAAMLWAVGMEAQGTGEWKSVSEKGFVFEWRVNGAELDCAVKAATTGWIAVGFNSSPRMNGANMIMGYVDGKGVTIEDHHGRGHGHVKDKRQDVSNPFGEERVGKTEIRFTIPLDSGDPQDYKLEPGRPVFVILAVGAKDGFKGKHTRRAAVRIDL